MAKTINQISLRYSKINKQNLDLFDQVIRQIYQNVIQPLKRTWIEQIGDVFGKSEMYYDNTRANIDKHTWRTDLAKCKELTLTLIGFSKNIPDAEQKEKFIGKYLDYKDLFFQNILLSLNQLLKKLQGAHITNFPARDFDEVNDWITTFEDDKLLDEFNQASDSEEYSTLSKKFDEFGLQVLSPSSKVGKFILESTADVYHVWEEACKAFPENKIRFEWPKKDIFLRIHPFSLFELFRNILSNKVHYAPRSNGITTLEIYGDLCKIVFKQDSNFIQRPTGLGINLVRKITEIYSGIFETISNEPYTFSISLPIVKK